MTSVLFDFSGPRSVALWNPINDGVMGGVSDSQLRHEPAGHGVFAGHVSFENNGGFALVRCPALLVHGVEDTTVPVSEAQAIHAARSGDHVRLKVIAASSLSDFIRGMRCRQTGMDARRAARAMVVPLPSGATPQTPGLPTTLRDGSYFGASRRCASSLGGHQSFVGAPCAASKIDPVAPANKVRQAARHRQSVRQSGGNPRSDR